MIFASLVRFYVFVMPPGGSKMLAVDVSIGPYQWLGRSPSHHEVLTPVQLLLRLQNHHHHTQAATTTMLQTSLAMDQEEKKQVQSIIDQLKWHSLPDGGEIVGSINLSSSEFTATNNRAHIVRQYESGSTASDRKTTRETPDRKGITFSLFRLEYLRQYFVRKLIIAVSVCILLAIILLCSIVSQLVRSSTQPSASQQVEIVQRILLSLCDDFAAATFDNSPYERIKYQGTFRSYEETKKPPEKPKEPKRPKEPEKPKPPPPKAPKKRKPPPKAPKRVQIEGRYIHLVCELRGGGHIGRAQRVGQDQSGSAASDFENERTREQGDPEEINATITLPAIMRHYGRRNRQDVAASLAISVSTFKRKCREFGIKRWPDVRKTRVRRPPDQHGEGNTSTARETPSHHVQTGMGGEPVGENREANVLRQDFMGGPIALNIESGLIMVARPPDQHGEKNTSTACEVPSHNVETGMEIDPVGQNQEANVFGRDFTEGPTALNTENGIVKTPLFHDSYPGNYPIDYKESENAGSSSERASQVNDQSTLSTPFQNHNALVFPQPQITSMLSENRGGSIDWGNSLASQTEPFSDTHISGSSNLAFPIWS